MPITNTSGFHDGFWKSLGEEERIEWAGARQAPHLQSILSANPDMVIVEATRYIGEAIGIVRKMQEFGGKMLGVSFEANKNGVPLPLDGEPRTFAGISALLNEEAGPDLTVFVGANCAGVSVITPILERRDTLDYVYPNRADFNGDQASYARFVQLELKGKRRSAKEEGEFLKLKEQVNTPDKALAQFAKVALENGALVVGGCCGTNMKTVKEIRETYDDFKRTQRSAMMAAAPNLETHATVS